MEENQAEMLDSFSHNHSRKLRPRSFKGKLFLFYSLLIEYQPFSKYFYCLVVILETLQFMLYLSLDLKVVLDDSSFEIGTLFKFANMQVLIVDSGSLSYMAIVLGLLGVYLLYVGCTFQLISKYCSDGYEINQTP